MAGKILFIVLCLLLVLSEGIAQEKKNTSSDHWVKNDRVFSDESQAHISIYKDSSIENRSTGWKYRSTEVNYKMLSFFGDPFGSFFKDAALSRDDINYYITKITAARIAYQGSENADKTITVAITPVNAPQHKPFLIRKRCDAFLLSRNIIRLCGMGVAGVMIK